jgi:hypothetical protein
MGPALARCRAILGPLDCDIPQKHAFSYIEIGMPMRVSELVQCTVCRDLLPIRYLKALGDRIGFGKLPTAAQEIPVIGSLRLMNLSQ